MQSSIRFLKRYFWLLLSSISVVYLLWSIGSPAAVALLMLSVPAIAVGLVLGILAAIVAIVLRKRKQVYLWILAGTVLGSLIGTVNLFALGCRVVEPYCYLTIATSEYLGDDFGLIPFGIVVVFFVPIGCLLGAILGGIWGSRASRHG